MKFTLRECCCQGKPSGLQFLLAAVPPETSYLTLWSLIPKTSNWVIVSASRRIVQLNGRDLIGQFVRLKGREWFRLTVSKNGTTKF